MTLNPSGAALRSLPLKSTPLQITLMSAAPDHEYAHDDALSHVEWVEEGHWATRIAWPQVVTLAGISLAVLGPLFAAVLLA